MQISRNQDWEKAAKRLEAFWQREIIDRPCIQVYAPAECSETFPDDSGLDVDTQWTDPAVFFRSFRRGYMHGTYMGEALPNMYPNWESVSVMLGSDVKYAEGTIWVRPTVHSILDVSTERLSMDHPQVKELLAKLDYCAAHSKGEAFIGLPPMGNAGDNLAKVCGFTPFCMELLDEPEAIMRIEKQLTAFWKQLYDAVYATLSAHQQGTCGWLPAWHPGRSALIEFDLGALVSPEIYKMYLPELLERAQHCERSIYHLDGPAALTHLDTILAQKEFDAIQWEPGIDCTNILEWVPVMRKIQQAGKGLYVAGPRYPKDAILQLLKELRPEGLILPVSVGSIQEGEEFLETVARLYR